MIYKSLKLRQAEIGVAILIAGFLVSQNDQNEISLLLLLWHPAGVSLSIHQKSLSEVCPAEKEGPINEFLNECWVTIPI